MAAPAPDRPVRTISAVLHRGGRLRPVDRADARPPAPRPGTVAAGAVAASLLVGAGAVALLGSGGDPATTGPAAAAAAASVPAPPAQLTRTGAPTRAPAGDPTAVEPLLTPPAVSWQLFAGVALPYSRTAGPSHAEGPVHSGFARSQTGALLAAAHLTVRALLTPGDGWREVVRRQVLPGVGRDVYLRHRAEVEPDDPPGTYGQLAGFRVVAFSPDLAVLQTVHRFPRTGRLQLTTTSLRWAAGDWRLELQPDGGSSPTAQAVPGLDGFVVWGGI